MFENRHGAVSKSSFEKKLWFSVVLVVCRVGVGGEKRFAFQKHQSTKCRPRLPPAGCF
jgi:hypothetical protein